MSKKPCLICNTEAEEEQILIEEYGRRHGYYIKCPRCSEYQLDSNYKGYLKDILNSDKEIAILSHTVHKMKKKYKIPYLDIEVIDASLKNSIPSPSEQINNLILWLGDEMEFFGNKITKNISYIQSEIGSINTEATYNILDEIQEGERKLITVGNQAGAWDSLPVRTLTLNSKGWELYTKLSQYSDRTEARQLLNYLLQQSNSGDIEIILKHFSWHDEQFLKTFTPLEQSGFVKAQYADNRPFTIWITNQGKQLIKDPFKFFSDLGQGNTSYYQQGDNYSVNIPGQSNNIAIGPKASVNQGISISEAKQLFADIFSQIEQRDIPNPQKEEIKETVELIQDEVSKGDEANEKALTSFFRTLQKMAPDILDVIIVAATNPTLAFSVIVKKVAEKIKSDAK